MRRFLPFLASLLLVAGGAAGHAQEQEEGMLQRTFAKRNLALQAMNANPQTKKKSKAEEMLASPLTNKKFESGSLPTKNFGTASYGGIKGANIESYETRSFLGLKNPWFGNRVFDASANRLASRSARESREAFETEAFAVKPFAKGTKEDLAAANAALAADTRPRPYLVTGKTQPGLDRFTENLKKDLTIDDVRDLLNKGKGE